jgi:hypothetical protein
LQLLEASRTDDIRRVRDLNLRGLKLIGGELFASSERKHSTIPRVALPNLRFDADEAGRILRISRAQLYNRIQAGSLKRQKDGSRTYIAHAELERYVEACNAPMDTL